MPENETNEKQQPTTVRSIRASEAVFEKLKEITAASKMNNQGEALTALVHLWEMDQAKNAIPDRATEIDNYRAALQKLENFFLHALEVNMGAEDRIRQEFSGQLEANATTINSLQNAKKTADKELSLQKEKIEELMTQHNETVKNLTAEKEAKERQAIEFSQKLADKDKLNVALAEQLEADKARIKELEDQLLASAKDQKIIAEQKTGLKEMKEQKEELAGQVERLQEKLAQMKRDHDYELKLKDMEAEKKVLEAERTVHIRIRTMQDEFLKRWDEHQKFLLQQNKPADPA